MLCPPPVYGQIRDQIFPKYFLHSEEILSRMRPLLSPGSEMSFEVGDTNMDDGRVSWKIDTMGSMILHEYTHFIVLVAPPLTREADDARCIYIRSSGG